MVGISLNWLVIFQLLYFQFTAPVFAKENVDPLKTEKSNIWIRGCRRSPNDDLFPLEAQPSTWPSCGYDAYEFTWNRESPNGFLLEGLSDLDLMKMQRSMGFCPHLRCQLGDLAHPPEDGACPENLCYTKLQSGYRTFGACCFSSNGSFNSGELIGYSDLIRPIPKPIYKRNRIVLGDNPNDEQRDSFINANEVYPGLISTQCPQKSSLNRFKWMMHQYNVSLVIQMHPHQNATPPKDPTFCKENLYHSSCRRPCHDWVSSFFSNPADPLAEGIGDLQAKHYEAMKLYAYNYTLWGNPVSHLWYNNWKDFSVPTDNATLLLLAQEAVDKIQGGGRVVVSCYSGRGRSGTFAALVLGLLHEFRTVTELVDSVVHMRESRDGLMELPTQLKYVQELLELTPSRTPTEIPGLISALTNQQSNGRTITPDSEITNHMNCPTSDGFQTNVFVHDWRFSSFTHRFSLQSYFGNYHDVSSKNVFSVNVRVTSGIIDFHVLIDLRDVIFLLLLLCSMIGVVLVCVIKSLCKKT